jgi:oligopeptide/dipeptide ABC transporter ATP-binding protein
MSQVETATAAADVDERPARPLLEVEQLVKHFPVRAGSRHGGDVVRSVDGVSFHIRHGEALGLVGESGCGKSTLARTVLRLTSATSGRVIFDGIDVHAVSRRDLKALRRRMQIIFQDPHQSLDPRMRLGQSVGVPLQQHGLGTRAERADKVRELFEQVGLAPRFMDRYPHECSGGQLQRVGIARALSLGPDLLVGDEPTSALDVSVQAQVLNLLARLRHEFSLTYLMISHDLDVVRHVCDRVAVMYLGKLVEIADRDELFSDPLHPYTQALLSAVPSRDPRRDFAPVPLEGDPPSPIAPPPGCRFHPRCPVAIDTCARQEPQLREVRPGHWVACVLP